MEAFLTECCFVFGCEGLSCSKDECFSAEIVELRCDTKDDINTGSRWHEEWAELEGRTGPATV
jgi:hypothetical protein